MADVGLKPAPHGGWRSWREADGPFFRQQVAHEAGHCFIMENVSGYTSTTYNARNAHWWDESAAEFLTSRAYPTMDSEHRSAVRFDLDGQTFTQAYNAFILFEHIISTHGNSTFLPLLDSLHETHDFETITSLFKARGWERLFHDFTVLHYNTEIPDPGCSGSSFCVYPTETDIDYLHEVTLEEGSGKSIEVPTAGAGRLNLIAVNIPRGFDVNTGVLQSPGTSTFATVTHGGRRHLLNQFRVFELECNSDGRFDILISHLESPELAGIEIPYTLTEKDCSEDDDGEDETTEASCSPAAIEASDLCLAGHWVPDKDQLRAQMQSVMTIGVGEVSDGVRMTICPGGRGRYDINDFVITSPTPVGVMKLSMNGDTVFEWQTNGTVFQAEMDNFSINTSGELEMTDPP